MNDQDVFIGRKKELQMIDEMVFDPTGARHILPMVGEGGVGKTWLFREIYRRYERDPKVLVLRIDYGETRTQSLPALSLHIIKQCEKYIPEEQTTEYFRRMSLWEQSAAETVLDDVPEEEVYNFGINLMNQISKERRILILSDTTEASTSLALGHRVNALASQFLNTVIVLAGRPTDYVLADYASFQEIYAQWIVHKVYKLEPFSDNEVNQYFDEVLPETAHDLREKIILLTRGNPVLIAIAGEWLRRNIALPEDIDSSLEELHALDESALVKRRQQFESKLIDKVRTLHQPIDWAVLYLAYLNRRYDPRILQLALNIQDEVKLKEIIRDLSALVFVRKSMTAGGELLHDEAQRLIRQHAWPVVDPDGELRRSLAQKVINEYYLPEIERLSEFVRGKITQALEQGSIPIIPDEEILEIALQVECLDYQFRISDEAGWAYLDQLLEEALSHRSMIRIEAIEQAINNLALQHINSARFKTRVAQSLLVKKDRDRAASLAQSALDAPDITPSDAASAFITLAECTAKSSEKTIHFKAALEKARLAQRRPLEATILNNLGQTYRQLGQWPEAEETYKQALRLWDEQKDREQYAMTLNNLAFVYMLTGNLSRADGLAEKALRIRKDMGNLYRLSFSYSTKGRIAEAMGDYAHALRYHRMAVDLCKSSGNDDDANLWQVNVAAAERRAHNFEVARQLLASALTKDRSDIRTRALHQFAKIDVEEARVLTSRGAATSDVIAKYESANNHARQALKIAEQLGDDYQIADILLDLALITVLKDKSENKECLQALRKILEDHNYILIKGRLAELEGDLAYIGEEIFTAFNHYLEACDILASYSPASFRQTFERVRDKFMDASSDMQVRICQMIEKRFPSVHPASSLAALKELCVGELDF